MRNEPSPKNKSIETFEDLVAPFLQGCKPKDQHRIGIEHEKIGIFQQTDGTWSAPFFDGPETRGNLSLLLHGWMEMGWQPIWENDTLIGLQQEGSSVTLEPGGQLEFSGAPMRNAIEVIHQLDQHMSMLFPLAKKQSIGFIGCGFRPFGTLSAVPKTPKKRYAIMRDYLPKQGQLGLDMMHRTASVQVNMDYASESDATAKLRLATALSPVLVALFAASPLANDKPTGYQSTRAHCWTDTDPSRCGAPPFVFTDSCAFASYANWALDIPMFFAVRDGDYIPMEHVSFRQFWKTGFQGTPATLADWELHLSTLFPEARLKQYIEIRSADAGPMEMVRALPCLWQGILYSDEASLAAWDVVKRWTPDERAHLSMEAPRYGIRTRIGKHKLVDFCKEIIEISNHGLSKQHATQEQGYLKILWDIVQTGQSIADRILETHRTSHENPLALVSLLDLESCP